MSLFKVAAKHNSVPAQSYLGYMYSKGKGVNKDFDTAFTWYMKAAEQGYNQTHD
ncbi:SEL1-like repeat protein [Pseudoalteromonas sp. C2R02]|nr:SEL1-like repeat protein [Pseudoalteromonas sp. C2R02]